MALAAAARAAVAELLTARASELRDHELRLFVDEVQALVAQSDAARLGAVRAVDRRPEMVPEAVASRAALALLMSRRVAARVARLEVLMAQHTDPDTGMLRRLGAALAAGRVWRGHVEVAVRALERIPRRLLRTVYADGLTGAERVDALLTQQSLVFSPSEVEVLARYLLSVLDPEGTNRRDAEAFRRRRCHAAFDSTGMYVGAFQLDPEAGATVAAAMAAFSAPLPVTWAMTPDGELVEQRDARDKGQRQADALATICAVALGRARTGHVHPAPTRPAPAQPAPAQPGPEPVGEEPAAAEPASGVPETVPDDVPAAFRRPGGYVGRVPAHVLITATPDQLAGIPAAGLATTNLNGPISPGTLRRLSCDAVLQKVLQAPSGAVLELGRSVRLASWAQRRAITARDGTCLIPGCGVPVALCDLHHVRSWLDGGPTDLPNLAPVCPRHHTAVHAGEYALTVHDGVPWVIPPPWVDPLRRPVRNPFTDAVQTVLRTGQELADREDRRSPLVAADRAPGTVPGGRGRDEPGGERPEGAGPTARGVGKRTAERRRGSPAGSRSRRADASKAVTSRLLLRRPGQVEKRKGHAPVRRAHRIPGVATGRRGVRPRSTTELPILQSIGIHYLPFHRTGWPDAEAGPRCA